MVMINLKNLTRTKIVVLLLQGTSVLSTPSVMASCQPLLCVCVEPVLAPSTLTSDP